jgi:hypothetical protein
MDKEREKLKKMAAEITSMEDKYDSSMRGVYLDILVSNYVQEKAEETVKMFDFIMTTQKEKYDSYGDIDTAVTKLKIKGFLDRFDPEKIKERKIFTRKIIRELRDLPAIDNDGIDTPIVDVEYQAMFLEDIFCGIDFLVLKIIHKNASLLGNAIEFHIRRVHKKIKKADLSLVKYGDLRDEGYTLSLNSTYGRPMELVDGRGMIPCYSNFESAFRALREVYIELSELHKP